MTLQRVSVVAVWQIMYMACAVYRFAEISQDAQGETSVSQYMTFELVAMFAIGVFGKVSTEARSDRVAREISWVASKREKSTVATILDMMCDCVVELDTDLRLENDVDKFTTFLTNKSLIGMPLPEFIPFHDDKQRVDDY
eukprot:CAMPEP_0179216340 /NCGR_PEP_ID=MMETSP0797-20121207/3326_1 /TAXON_ID=47934 /ORGANISM="Dinophysis acuminata, Strain DAEP01" /LENGTH=139 /DNA_ID=CAMNT_0020922491 /DNA_START=12 /DNA_END=428 /DNA_ORIENTATION=+